MGKKIGRVALGVGTLGGSEVWRAAGKKLGIGTEDEQGAYITPEDKRAQEYQKFLQDYAGETAKSEADVQNGAFTKDLFGSGGLQSQLATEGRNLADNGFQLTQGDREAYGQASGDVSRLFGQQEQAASQSLARRGLASASSGAAGATFSGLAGNKNEMLAKMQTDIAQKRMTDTQSRLQQNRTMQASLSQQGVNTARQRYQDKGQALSGSMGVEQALNTQDRQTMADQQAAVKPGLFSTIGQGLQAGIGNLATQAPGMLATGGIPIGGASGGQAPNTGMFNSVKPGTASANTQSASKYGSFA